MVPSKIADTSTNYTYFEGIVQEYFSFLIGVQTSNST